MLLVVVVVVAVCGKEGVLELKIFFTVRSQAFAKFYGGFSVAVARRVRISFVQRYKSHNGTHLSACLQRSVELELGQFFAIVEILLPLG